MARVARKLVGSFAGAKSKITLAPVSRVIRKSDRIRKVQVVQNQISKKDAVLIQKKMLKPKNSKLHNVKIIKSATKMITKKKALIRKKKIIEKDQPKVPDKKTTTKKQNHRPNITQYQENPLRIKNLTMPLISLSNHCKLAIRAVLTNDEKLLQQLIKDHNSIHSVHIQQSADVKIDPLTYSLIANKSKLLRLLITDFTNGPNDRVKLPKNLLQSQETGNYNFHMLGHAVRKIQMSRGGREGTNALLKDSEEFFDLRMENRIKMAIKHGLEFTTIKELMISGLLRQYVDPGTLVSVAARCGNRKLSLQLISEYGSSYFNELGKIVLGDSATVDLSQFKVASVRKKGQFNHNITPMHLATLNSNTKFLQELLKIDPDFQIDDSECWKPIHYGAVAETGDCLKLLLERGASPHDLTKAVSATPLHLACETGRHKNVRILCQFLKEKGDEILQSALKLRCHKRGMGPVHYAALEGHVEVLKVLFDFQGEAMLECRCTASTFNASALMLAAQQGHLEACQFLLASGSKIDLKDKLKRTALTYAVLNGQAHVASFLLRAGCNVEVSDSSGNTAAHYASAYGWYHCLKLLIEADIDLSKSNDWMLTPLSVAYMKNHMGLVDLILEQPNVNIDCRDASGRSLIQTTIIEGDLDNVMLSQLKYLILEKHANVNNVDSAGSNPLHYLASKKLDVQSTELETKRKLKIQLEIVKLLLENNCDIKQANEQKQTPILLAAQCCNLELTDLLFEKDGSVSPVGTLPTAEKSKNLLHFLVASSEKPLALEIAKKIDCHGFGIYCEEYDEDGYTPFLTCCEHYKKFSDEKEQCCKSFLKFIAERNPAVLTQRIAPKETTLGEKTDENEIDENSDQSSNTGTEDANEEGSELSESEGYVITFTEPRVPNTVECSDSTLHDYDLSKNKPINTSSWLHILVDKKSANDKNNPSNILQTLLDVCKSKLSSQNLKLLLEYEDEFFRTALFKSVQLNNSEAVKLLIQFGADVNFVQRKPIVTKIDEKKKSPPVINNITPLIVAVQSNDPGLVSLLLKAGANPDCCNSMKSSPLHYSCCKPNANTDIVKLLLDHKASIDTVDEKERSALHLLCNADRGGSDDSLDAVELLLDRGASLSVVDERDRLPLHYAFVKIGKHRDQSFIDPVALVSLLLKHNIICDIDFPDCFGNSPLHYAATRGANICCIVLMGTNKVKIDRKNKLENTPFGLAVQNKHYACALTLLQAGCETNLNFVSHIATDEEKEQHAKLDKWRWKPVRENFVEKSFKNCSNLIVENEWQGILYLMMQNPQLNQSLETFSDLARAALEEQKYNLATAILRSIPEKFRQNYQWANKLIETLALTAKRSLQLPNLTVCSIVDTLVDKHGAKIDERIGNTDFCVVYTAALKLNFGLMDYFLKKKSIQINMALSPNGRSVFSAFFDQKHNWTDQELAWLKTFITNHKIDIDRSALFTMPIDITESAQKFDTKYMKKLPPLIRCLHLDLFKVAKFLLKEMGADVNVKDQDGRTALMYAVMMNKIDYVNLLLNFDYKLDFEVISEESALAEEETLQHVVNTSPFGQLLNRKRKLTAPKKNVDNKKSKMVFEKTSPLDFSLVDNNGDSCWHYLAKPLFLGCWQSLAIADRLISCGADNFQLRNKHGKTPLDLAIQSCNLKLAEKMSNSKQKVEFGPFWSKKDETMFSNQKINSTDVDYLKDSEAFIEQAKNKAANETMSKESDVERPHRLTDMTKSGTISLDPETNRYLSILMSKIEQTGPYGFYNFYRLQIVFEKARQIYILFTNWGRMGDERGGQFQKTSFKSLPEALKEFKSIFKAKSGNDWSTLENLDEFQIKPGKYRLILQDKHKSIDCVDLKSKLIDFDKDVLPKSDLPDDLNSILRDMIDFDLLISRARSSINSNHPLVVSSLKRESILKAKKLLDKIATCIEKMQDLRQKLMSDHSSSEKQAKMNEQCSLEYQKLCDASCEFYFLLPLKGFEHSDVQIIDDVRIFRKYENLVNNLLDYELACKILLGSAYRKSTLHPCDYLMSALKCKLLTLDSNDWECQHILHYIYNSSPNVKITGIQKIFDQEKYGNFNPKNLQNRRLLWHGTGAENLIGVLSLGLVPVPFQSAQCGQMLGQGVYTADSFSKSMNYCRKACSGTSYMFLCEVALGKCKEIAQNVGNFDRHTTKVDFDSILGMGSNIPDPEYDILLPTGSVIPLGKIIERKKTNENSWYCLHMNEYVCFDPQQIIVRYLVSFKN